MSDATQMIGEIDWGDYKVRAIVHETTLDEVADAALD